MLKKSGSVEESYENLANGIIVQACNDYIYNMRFIKRCEERRHLDARTKKRLQSARWEVEDIQRFFHSEWYRELTSVNGDYILSKISEMI